MRIGIALIILIDLIIRSQSLTAFYTDEGVLPLSTLFRSNWNPSFFSLYAIATGWKIIAFLFLLNGLFAFLLLIGFHTRLMTFLCWMMIVSLHNRNPLILQGGDELLRLTLFWAMFIPWGKKYSVDSFIQPQDSGHYKWINWGGIGYIFLLFSVYFFSAILKNSDEWTKDGTALYYALSLDQLTWPFGKFLYQYPTLLKYLTLSTFYLELITPFLLFVPFRTPLFRLFFILLFAGFHLFISITLFVGLFYLIGLITLIGLLPEFVMNRIENKTKKIRLFFHSIFKKFSVLLSSRISLRLQSNISLSELAQYQIKLLYAGILIFIMAFNLLWCAGHIPSSKLKVNDRFLWLAYSFRFDQEWGMFAPRVYKNDGWYIYEAELESNDSADSTKKLIDLNRDGNAIDYKKPNNIIGLYQDDRWRKFGELWQYQSDKVKKEFCRYLKNKWNSEHPERRISTLKIIYMLEVSLPDYKSNTPERTIQCDCENWKKQ